MKCFSSIKYLITGSKFKLDLIRANNVYKKPQALFNICSRLFSNEINPSITNDEEQISSKPVKKKKKTPEKSKTNVLIHLENDANFQEIKDQIPEKLFKYRRVAPEGLYLINKDTAYDILFAILPYLQTSSAGESRLVEVNPGLGLLTDLLLNNWSREITLYEPNTQFVKALNALNEVHRNRINLYYTSFYDVWKLSYQDKHTSSKKVAALLGDLPQIPWGKDFCSTIIGIAPSNSFLNHLITSLVFQHSLMMWGRHQFFLVITPRQYIHYTCNGNTGYMFYRASSIMFQILFKFKFLCKVPRKSFLPWVHSEKKINTKTSKLRCLDSDHLYLVRLEPRENLYEFCKPQDLKQLWYFVRCNLLSRRNKVISCLERWVPNCGPKLIIAPDNKFKIEPAKTMNVDGFDLVTESSEIRTNDFAQNISIFTEFGDLTPSQLLSLFVEFKSWPEFSETTFITSMENMLLKLENPDEVLDVDDETYTEEIEEKNNKIDDENM